MKRHARTADAELSADAYVVPAHGEREAVLRLSRGAARLALTTTSRPSVLTAVHGDRRVRVAREQEAITVRYPRAVRHLREPIGIDLSDSVRWTIAFDKGAVDVDVDLRDADITMVRFASGASRVRLHLPCFANPGTVRFERAADRITILRPRSTGIIVRLADAATDIEIDGTLYDIARNTVLTSGPPTARFHVIFERAATRVVSCVEPLIATPPRVRQLDRRSGSSRYSRPAALQAGKR
jgi:hypothetical protein